MWKQSRHPPSSKDISTTSGRPSQKLPSSTQDELDGKVKFAQSFESGACHLKHEASGSSQWPVTAHVSTRWPPPGNVVRDESAMGVKGSTYCYQEYSFITLNSKKSPPPGDGQGEGLRNTLTRGRINFSVVRL
jgi:hypothetical protein